MNKTSVHHQAWKKCLGIDKMCLQNFYNRYVDSVENTRWDMIFKKLDDNFTATLLTKKCYLQGNAFVGVKMKFLFTAAHDG